MAGGRGSGRGRRGPVRGRVRLAAEVLGGGGADVEEELAGAKQRAQRAQEAQSGRGRRASGGAKRNERNKRNKDVEEELAGAGAQRPEIRIVRRGGICVYIHACMHAAVYACTYVAAANDGDTDTYAAVMHTAIYIYII